MTTNNRTNNSWIQPNSTRVNLPQSRTANTNSLSATQQNRISNVNQNEILCNCGSQAITTVKKDEPNKGRLFFKCQKGEYGGGCDYFLWATDDQTNVSQQEANCSFMQPPAASTDIVCNCGNEPVLMIVQKEGANQGRKFYVCSGSQQSKCNFFKWESDTDNNGAFTSDGGCNSQSFGGGSGYNSSFQGGSSSGRGIKRKASTSNSNNGGKSRRRCGICGEEGHIRSNCPNSG